MDTPRVTHMPAQPRQRHHTTKCTYIGTSTHRSPGKVRAHAQCPNPHPGPHYPQDPASYARPRSPRPSAVPHSPLLRLRLHSLHHHNHLIGPHHHVLVQHPIPQAAGETSQTGPQTRPHRKQPCCYQSPRADEARARSPAETQDRHQAATRTRRRAATSGRSQIQAQAKAGHHDSSASPTPRRRPLRHLAPAIPGPEAAVPSTAPPHRHRCRRHHLHGGARRGRSTTYFVPPPLKVRTPGPRTTLDRATMLPGSTSSVPAPLPTLNVSPRTANDPLPPPPRVPTQPRGLDCASIPGSPHPPAPPLPAHPSGTRLRGI